MSVKGNYNYNGLEDFLDKDLGKKVPLLHKLT